MPDISEPVLIFEGMPDLLPMQDRSEGIHISQIVHDMCVRLGHYKPMPLDMTRAQLGSALEWAICHRWAQDQPDRFVQIGELEKDGLFGTPDLVDTLDWAVEEIKLTWISSNHEPVDEGKFWRYWTQVKSYCYLVGTHIGRLSVCHINGNYRDSGPIYRKWERHFTGQELIENWRKMLSNAQRIREET